MPTLQLERFDATSNTAEVIGRFETNDIEYDVFQLDAFIVNTVDVGTDVKVLDIDHLLDWLNSPGNSLLVVASNNTVTFGLRKDNDEDNFRCSGAFRD